MRYGVTATNVRYLAKIAETVEHTGWYPSVRELCLMVGVAPSTVHAHLQALERAGLLERKRPDSEQMRITTLGMSALNAQRWAA